jgi:hypothetical protein
VYVRLVHLLILSGGLLGVPAGGVLSMVITVAAGAACVAAAAIGLLCLGLGARVALAMTGLAAVMRRRRTGLARFPGRTFATGRGLAGRAMARRAFLCAFALRTLFGARLPATAVAFPPGASFWARRTRFHALRAEADCLRARLASRLASLSRLRARLSSSFAIRTRCLATSAWSLARSSGSVGGACSLPVFFIHLARD